MAWLLENKIADDEERELLEYIKFRRKLTRKDTP